MPINDQDEYEFALEQRKHNTTPLPEYAGFQEGLPQRKKRRTSTKKRKSNKHEVQYQRFVQDLHKDIQVCMERRLRENSFDTRSNQSIDSISSYRSTRNTFASKRSTSTITTHRTNEIDSKINSNPNLNGALALIKQNETKRLEADVQMILTGSVVKNFYTKFIRPSQQRRQTVAFEKSLIYASER